MAFFIWSEIPFWPSISNDILFLEWGVVTSNKILLRVWSDYRCLQEFFPSPVGNARELSRRGCFLTKVRMLISTQYRCGIKEVNFCKNTYLALNCLQFCQVMSCIQNDIAVLPGSDSKTLKRWSTSCIWKYQSFLIFLCCYVMGTTKYLNTRYMVSVKLWIYETLSIYIYVRYIYLVRKITT